jgi:ketosteroid isomerase-like protein
MYKVFTAVAVCLLVAGPAAATDKTDVMAVIHQWVNDFNKGDMKSMVAACAEQSSIIDDFPPHEWHGAGTCSKWADAFQAFSKSAEITSPAVAVGKPRHIDVTGDAAYVVAPASFSFEQKGKPVKQRAVVTLALQKGSAGWRIAGWAWADQ